MELALPITVYWDLASDTSLDDALLRLCDEILECRPLMLQLYDPAVGFSEAGRGILERFKGKPVAVSLTVPSSSAASLAGVSLIGLGVKELLLAYDYLESVQEVSSLPQAGISFSVNRENWRELPQVVSFCRERVLNRLVLPMQRLYNGDEPFLLDRSEQELLAGSLAAVGGTDGLRLTIHDPFLWRAFNPGVPFPQAGCQAANTMIAISPDGGVYPCPTLPEQIGKVGGSLTLKEIITSPLKRELRTKIVRFPSACGDCHELAVCRGGCRGRSKVINGTFDGIDDACR
jgi:GeoRSP system SPASM domain protein